MKKRLHTIVFFLICVIALVSCKKNIVKDVNVNKQIAVTEEPIETADITILPESTVLTDEVDNSAEPSEGALQENTEETQKKETAYLLPARGYTKLEDAAESAKSVMNKKHENITFDEDFDVTVPDEIGEYEFVQTKTFNKDGESAAKFFLGDLFNIKLLEEFSYDDTQDYSYVDEANYISFFTSANGACSCDYEQVNNLWDNYTLRKKPIYLYSNYDKKTAYPVKGGEMTIPEVIEAGKEFTEKYTNQYGDLTWSPYVIYMKEEDDGNYGFLILYSVGYNGLTFCPLQDDVYSEEYDTKMGFDIGQNVMDNFVYIDSIDGISVFYNEFGLWEYQETKRTYHQILSFESAAEIVDEKISDSTSHNIINAELGYWSVMEDYKGVVVDGFDCSKGGNVWKTKPYWIFYTGESQSEEPDSCVIVDCFTGKYYQTKTVSSDWIID